VELNESDRSLKVKIAYYGPAVGGKTTNLNLLYQHAQGARRGDFISVNSQQDRTILCDLLPLRAGGFCGFDVRLQLLAVPGQTVYVVSRRAVLQGSDGVVFVANSATDRWHENLQSFGELNSHLRTQKINPSTIPLVLQYNKRDLPQVLEIEALNRGLNQRGAPAIPAVARKGEGVLETFAAVLEATLTDLARRHPALKMPPRETVADWTQKALRSIFGRDSLAGVTAAEEPKPGSRPLKLQIPMPEEVGRTPGPAGDLRSAESLAESYAQASAELGLALNELRLERDRAQGRLTEIQLALSMAEAGSASMDLEGRALRVLQILAEAADASAASFFLTMTDASEVLVLPPLRADPMARVPAGAAFLEARRGQRKVELLLAADDDVLVDTLATAEPPFKAVVLIPLRSAERLLGLALLYFSPHARVPSADALEHLGLLARVLAGPLEATAAREATTDAGRLRTLSRASAAAMTSVLTRLPPHALRREPLVIEDLVAPLRAAGVTVEVAPNTPAIKGDAALLRFALTTLIHHCEAAALDRHETPEIRLRARPHEYAVQIDVMSGPVTSEAELEPKLDFDAEAEVTTVNAVLAHHNAFFVMPQGEVAASHFTMQFDAL
jgi:signal recognition particle receptor subunit beta